MAASGPPSAAAPAAWPQPLVPSNRSTERRLSGMRATSVGRSALDLARLAYSQSSLDASVGLAAIDALLEADEARCLDVNAGDLLIERGRAKNVALIGHFPFVPRLRQAARATLGAGTTSATRRRR